jgi:hypothetical protein
MNLNQEQVTDLVLEEGPFARDWVERWPAYLQQDYLELLGLDLIQMGLEDFRGQARFLGETFLLSLDRPIERCPYLLESWNRLTGGEPVPERPVFYLM